MSFLFTGFEPFGGEVQNPSRIVAQTLSRKAGGDCLILPVAYDRAFEILRPAIETGKYQGIISIGQAGGRSKVGLERVALNFEDTEMADADGKVQIEKEIEPGGPHAIMNHLPLREIVAKLSQKIGPVEISSSAGTYVCNSLYYKTFRWMEKNPSKLMWQMFVHVPYLPEQVFGKPDSTPFLPQSVMEQIVWETFQIVKSLNLQPQIENR